MLDGSLDQGSLICLGYAYFFSIPEPEYAYKCYAYKNIKTCIIFQNFSFVDIVEFKLFLFLRTFLWVNVLNDKNNLTSTIFNAILFALSQPLNNYRFNRFHIDLMFLSEYIIDVSSAKIRDLLSIRAFWISLINDKK